MKAGRNGILRACKEVLLADLAIFVLAAISCLFTGGFALRIYSDRLLWAGMAATLVGGAAGLLGGIGSARHTDPATSRTPAEDLSYLNRRYSGAPHHLLAFRLWAIGLICIVAGVLVGNLAGKGL